MPGCLLLLSILNAAQSGLNLHDNQEHSISKALVHVKLAPDVIFALQSLRNRRKVHGGEATGMRPFTTGTYRDVYCDIFKWHVPARARTCSSTSSQSAMRRLFAAELSSWSIATYTPFLYVT